MTKWLWLIAFALIAIPNVARAEQSTSATGIELPADQTVDFDEGYITIKATCKGEVRWLVLCDSKIKFSSFGNSIIISIPPVPKQVINVFAVGVVDGHPTEFVRTNITVKGPDNLNPVPNPDPVPSGKYHITFIVDMNQTSPELAAVLNSVTVQDAINKVGKKHVYDIKNPVVTKKGLDVVAKKVNSSSVMIIQNEQGAVVINGIQAIPRTEAETIALINKILGVK